MFQRISFANYIIWINSEDKHSMLAENENIR